MTEREKLTELLDIIIQPGQKTLGDIADHLLANGVIVPHINAKTMKVMLMGQISLDIK